MALLGNMLHGFTSVPLWFTSLVSPDPKSFYKTISWIIIACGVPTFLALLKQRAPYGRYAPVNQPVSRQSRYAWLLGPGVPAQIAWAVQESPSFFVPIVMMLLTSHRWSRKTDFSFGINPGSFLLGLYLLHYFQRSFIYPTLIRGGKPTPAIIVVAAAAYCGTIGLIQYLAIGANHYGQKTWTQPHFLIGCALFFAGMWINIRADAELRRLRRARNDVGYSIPRGGMFEYVSAANYFGECLEWCGYALACWNLAAVAFAFFTVCNLTPRAIEHHRWYKQKFENYPRNRKAIIPFVL